MMVKAAAIPYISYKTGCSTPKYPICPITTNSIINGTLFKEEHRLFLKNIEKGYITIWNRIGIVRYFIKYVERTRNDFLGSSIYNECLALWQQEMDYRDAHLPLLYRILCLMQKIFT